MFRLEFSTDNAAFDPLDGEVVRILREVADRIDRVGIDYGDRRTVHDLNGNTVGSFKVERS